MEHNYSNLYIIGNGFDCSHGIDSKYVNFYSHLSKYYAPFLQRLGEIYPQLSAKGKLWSELEKELSNYDIPERIGDTALDQMKTLESYQEGEIDYATLDGFIEAGIDDKMISITNELKVYFNSWVAQISISNCKTKYTLNKKSLFITFNYTRTLEEIYKIKDNNICHIHGKVGDPSLVLGHCWEYNKREYSSRDSFPPIKSIIDPFFRRKVIRTLEKRCDEIISDNLAFFDRIENVTKITILGHSLSKVDMPYFKEISEQVDNKAIWNISYHSEADKKRISEFKAELHLKSGNCNLFKI